MSFNLSQDAFNKLITLILLIFALIIISLAYAQNRPIDPTLYGALIAPIVTHSIHLMSNKIADKQGSNGDGHST